MRTRRDMPPPQVTLLILMWASSLLVALLELFAWAGRHNLFGL